MCDTDSAKNLREKSFAHVDPFSGAPKDRHIFWGIIWVMRWHLFEMAVLAFIDAIATFMLPIGVNRLLNYVEVDGVGEIIRPWFWILFMLGGTSLDVLSIERYIFLSSKTATQTQSILTQLLYDHAMRIRIKADTNVSGAENVGSGTDSASEGTLHTTDDGETMQASVSTDSQFKSTLVPPAAEEPSRFGDLMGRLNNLISTDMDNIFDARNIIILLILIPVQVILAVGFLYTILGWSALAGMALMVLLLPVPGWIAKSVHSVQVKRMKETDARAQAVTEFMSVLRMIKLFGWEGKTDRKIMATRENELRWIKILGVLDALSRTTSELIPFFTMVVIFFIYTLIMGKELHASKIFSSVTALDLIRVSFRHATRYITQAIAGKVSFDRVHAFLHETEVIDSFDKNYATENLLQSAQPEDDEIIGFEDATSAWTSELDDGTLMPSRRAFKLQINGRLEFKRGCVNLVVGATGSGKTSLLMALLGEMHLVPSPIGWRNLPRKGGVAYAAQQSWVQNETIRENILFGSPFDEARYKKVIYQVGLERDLDIFAAGDNTEVGEKGLTLSGGQKARVTLARAIYSPAEIILLDDILAALDVHTARWIVEKCLAGDLVQGRTVILVTHNIGMTSPIAKFVVALGADGRIVSQGTVADALAKDSQLAAEAEGDAEDVTKATTAEEKPETNDRTPASNTDDGKLILAEDINQGRVSWPAIKLLLAALGGKNPVTFWVVFMFFLCLNKLFEVLKSGWLGVWANQYDNRPASEINAVYYIGILVLVVLGSVSFTVATAVIYLYGKLRASRSIHQRLVESILGSTFRWLDETPTSRIISRCTRDIRSIDGPVPAELFDFIWISVVMLLKLGAVVLFSPIFVLPGIAISLVGNYIGQRYIKAALSVKRELSNASAPVLSQFDAALTGLVSIRAYNVQESFKNTLMSRVDMYTRTGRTFYNLNEWIAVRIYVSGSLFTVGLATYLFYSGHGGSSAEMGFSLNMAIGFSSMILWWIRTVNEFEVACNSLERIAGYLDIEQEEKHTDKGVPPAYWPASGDLRVERLSARYSKNGPKVLHDISFHIEAGERVGIVGRTGSGKSSLTLSLLRCILTEGTVYYDGLATNTINLDRLRESITIIPQVPELLVGTLRENLDPFGENDDAVLNSALRSSGLFSLEEAMVDGQITLDSAISAGGGNLSVGQRQIIALARAIIRNSKLLILDEATSAIDYKTDEVIQASLRHELGKDVTLLTVAHRLVSIMDSDRIMVLDAGRIVEFDTPRELLKNEKGLLWSLVDESGDRDILLAMVNE